MLFATLLAETGSDGIVLAWIILVGMIAALFYTSLLVWRGFNGRPPPAWPPALQRRLIPVLAVIGLGVAGYLAYVETTATPAVCGPVGDCNAVQNSPFSKLFGLPLGVVGLIGYAVILAAWWYGNQRNALYGDQMPLIVFCVALFSVFFSIYLTVVEIFVIRAVCIWCLTSALLVTLIMLAATAPMLVASGLTEDAA